MSIVASLVGPVTGLLDKFIEDKDQKNALAHEIATLSEKHAQDCLEQALGFDLDAELKIWISSEQQPSIKKQFNKAVNVYDVHNVLATYVL